MRNVFYFIFLFLTSFYMSCSEKPTETEDEQNVWVTSIFFSDQVDTDNDGYLSFARLNFDLDTDAQTLNVIVKVGIRVHSSVANPSYDLYFQSLPFDIHGETAADAMYIVIGGENGELEEGNYDFLFQVFDTDDQPRVVAEASSTSHSNLTNIKFERSSQELSPKWISNIDDGIFEGSYIIPQRPPLGLSVNALAEKFEISSATAAPAIKKIRIHIPVVINPPQQITFSVYSDNDNKPFNKLFTSNSYNISNTGWNVFDLEYDLAGHPVFYISVPPGSQYAVSTDNNSESLNGYRYEYVSSNPPREGWVAENINYAIDVYIDY